MRVMFAGDWHASSAAAWAAMRKCAEMEVDALVHVGDFLFTGPAKHRFLSSLEKAAHRFGIPVYFIRGNHDDTVYLNRIQANHDFSQSPFIPVSQNVFYIPDGTVWEWEGVRLGGLGGAFSVDHNLRTEGKDWWADEVTSEEDAEKIIESAPLDLLVTHDIPDIVTLRSNEGALLPPHWDINGSIPNRQLITKVVEAVSPLYHIAGHMHLRQTTFLPVSFGKTTRSIILDRGDYEGRENDIQVLSNSLLLMELKDGTITL